MPSKTIYNAKLTLEGTGRALEKVTMDLLIPELSLDIQRMQEYWTSHLGDRITGDGIVSLSFPTRGHESIFNVEVQKVHMSASLYVDRNATIREVRELAGAPESSRVFFHEDEMRNQSVKRVTVTWEK